MNRQRTKYYGRMKFLTHMKALHVVSLFVNLQIKMQKTQIFLINHLKEYFIKFSCFALASVALLAVELAMHW